MYKYMIQLSEADLGESILDEKFQDFDEAVFFIELKGFKKESQFKYRKGKTIATICRLKKMDTTEVVIDDEVMTLFGAVKKYGVYRYTIKRRYDRGLRGEDLIKGSPRKTSA